MFMERQKKRGENKNLGTFTLNAFKQRMIHQRRQRARKIRTKIVKWIHWYLWKC